MDIVIPVMLSALITTIIIALRYLASSGFFAWMTRKVHPGHYQGLQPQIRKEIGWSLLSVGIYGVPAGIIGWGWHTHGWTLIYDDITSMPLWYAPLSVLLYMLAHDTWFYWTHRWMHQPKWFRIAHAVHHESRPPTAWAAMSFHPVEAITGAVVIPALVFLIPIHVSMLGVVLTIMTVMGVTNHMGWEMFPGWVVRGPLGRLLITASHHEQHHQAYKCNYGLYFRHWDRLCGTDHGLADWSHERTNRQPIRARTY